MISNPHPLHSHRLSSHRRSFTIFTSNSLGSLGRRVSAQMLRFSARPKAGAALGAPLGGVVLVSRRRDVMCSQVTRNLEAQVMPSFENHRPKRKNFKRTRGRKAQQSNRQQKSKERSSAGEIAPGNGPCLAWHLAGGRQALGAST